MSATIKIDEGNAADRYRFLCPNGHTTWERTNNHFWCATCSRSVSGDAVFNYLHDQLTEESVHRSQIRFEE